MPQLNNSKADALLLCHKCKLQFKFSEGVTERLETRVKKPNVTEFGIKCPGCENWTHAYWMTVALEVKRANLAVLRKAYGSPKRTQRDILRYDAAAKKYRYAYDQVQKEMYAATGTKPTMVREHVVE